MIDDEEGGQGNARRIAIRVEAGKPISFDGQMPPNDAAAPGAEEARRIVRALSEYRAALGRLVSTKYAAVAPSLPGFYLHPVNILILRCTDGVLVRYERCLDERPWTKCGSINQPLEKIAPGLSDNFVHIPADRATYQIADGGPRLQMSTLNADGTQQVHFEVQPIVIGTLAPPPPPTTGQRPMPIISVTNELECQLVGHIESTNASPREITHSEQFVGRARGVMSVGWEAIEVYPTLPKERWDESFATAWAELDLLATLAQRNIDDASFAQLDGRGQARRRYAALLSEFESLLTGHEEPLHQFLKRNPELISPTSVRRWSKVPHVAG
jgi:hypothetical protein